MSNTYQNEVAREKFLLWLQPKIYNLKVKETKQEIKPLNLSIDFVTNSFLLNSVYGLEYLRIPEKYFK